MQPLDLDAELRRHHVASFGWASSCCDGAAADAEDVLHDAYVRILSGRARFHGRSSFRTWLFGVIRRTAQEARRAQRRRNTLWGRSEGALAEQTESSHDHLERAQEAGMLIDALQHLSERQRQVLHLVFYQDLTIEEAAAVMGVTVGSARTHYQRGKDRLRSRLEQIVVP
jgi:RNA polymerase sigma-70 factor (ECF subfamily)